MKKLKAKWSYEPGDGTGCSLADAQVRNDWGKCAVLGCENQLAENAVSRGLYCKLCPEHDKQVEEQLQSLVEENWQFIHNQIISNMDNQLTEELVALYGEKHRLLITDALQWLEIKEPTWQLDKPIDKKEYIRDLIDHAK